MESHWARRLAGRPGERRARAGLAVDIIRNAFASMFSPGFRAGGLRVREVRKPRVQ
ncbi:hypothetical protein WQQ_27700 [Hydrocarboniphaga effusa AP103]|uniref:Uncharacterized protein n=1 Tax=Hydrocarboniphaga effusa AP103 TaxID=1172194 RepID=I8T627_9GAMM|nr:hypothetical protein WQQ_27700 [Hydrocarboniphaga effusa AP103]